MLLDLLGSATGNRIADLLVRPTIVATVDSIRWKIRNQISRQFRNRSGVGIAFAMICNETRNSEPNTSEIQMKILSTCAVALITLAFSGCEQSALDRQSESIRDQTQQQADQIRDASQADAEHTRDATQNASENLRTRADNANDVVERNADQLEASGENAADRKEASGERKADAVEELGEAKADALEEQDN
jgi:hypothetical protein